jgi:hypothetical protein
MNEISSLCLRTNSGPPKQSQAQVRNKGILCFAEGAGVRVGRDASPDRAGKENQISNEIYDDEGCGPPGFLARP